MKETKKKKIEGNFQIENPLRDFHIFFPPSIDIMIKKGKPVSVPIVFKQNLITEKVFYGEQKCL